MEEIKQVGHGSLHVITSVEEKHESKGRSLWTDTKLLWFKIAHLDKDKKVIENNVVTFEGATAPSIADFLSSSLQDLLERTYVGSIQMGNSNVMVVRLDDGGSLIKNGSFSIKVAQGSITELADKLGYISAITHVKSYVGK